MLKCFAQSDGTIFECVILILVSMQNIGHMSVTGSPNKLNYVLVGIAVVLLN